MKNRIIIGLLGAVFVVTPLSLQAAPQFSPTSVVAGAIVDQQDMYTSDGRGFSDSSSSSSSSESSSSSSSSSSTPVGKVVTVAANVLAAATAVAQLLQQTNQRQQEPNIAKRRASEASRLQSLDF